ncbi:MAG: NUDIX domain-containing protein, partial [Nitrososphaeraceae archaeon]|nr:NUDIX domain-containing protein [Nitrososphaeraceae archaeon]
MNPNQIPPCAGVIVIDLTNLETILVCTDHDNYSFPKGKRHKGETIMDNALRELNEETGLTKDDIQ